MLHTIIVKQPAKLKIKGVVDFDLQSKDDRIIVTIDAPTIEEAKRRILSALEGIDLE